MKSAPVHFIYVSISIIQSCFNSRSTLEKNRYIIGIFLSILVIFLGLIEPINKQKKFERDECLFIL